MSVKKSNIFLIGFALVQMVLFLFIIPKKFNFLKNNDAVFGLLLIFFGLFLSAIIFLKLKSSNKLKLGILIGPIGNVLSIGLFLCFATFETRDVWVEGLFGYLFFSLIFSGFLFVTSEIERRRKVKGVMLKKENWDELKKVGEEKEKSL